MLILYHGGGARDFELDAKCFREEEWERIKQTTCRLLRARRSNLAADMLENEPFDLFDARNGFGDEFTVLYARLSFATYLELSELCEDPTILFSARDISSTLNETCSRYVRFVAAVLDTGSPESVTKPELKITSQVVERALADAEQLILTRGAVSGVDRAYTAIHGYLRVIVRKIGVEADTDASIVQLFKLIRESSPEFKVSGSRDDEINKILRSIASILDALSPIRNRTSIAHPNEVLSQEAEAMLVINTVKTLLHYLDAKIGRI
jgi:hypothetical protein